MLFKKGDLVISISSHNRGKYYLIRTNKNKKVTFHRSLDYIGGLEGDYILITNIFKYSGVKEFKKT